MLPHSSSTLGEVRAGASLACIGARSATVLVFEEEAQPTTSREFMSTERSEGGS